MFNGDICDVMGDAVKNGVNVGIEASVFNNFVPDHAVDDPVIAGYNGLGPPKKNPGGNGVKLTGNIFKKRIFADRILSVNQIIAFLYFCQKNWKLGGMCLHIVIHSHNQIPLGILKTCHNGVMLSKIFRKADTFHKRVFLTQAADYVHGVIFGVVVYQYKLYAIVWITVLQSLYGQLHKIRNGML